MKEFSAIRKAALAKRDAAIKKARDEYAATLVRVAELEQDILGRDPSDHRSQASCINSLLPSDRTFTTVDIMAGLEAMNPGKVWRKRSMDAQISVLRKKGIVRRIKRSKGASPAVYAHVSVEVEPQPFGDMSLADAAAEVLKQRGPLTQTELVVLLLEAGYESSMPKRTLRDALGTAMREDAERFKIAGEKWTIA